MFSDPEIARQWVRVVRDLLIVGVGAFMLIHETVVTGDPNPYLLAGGLTALGLPPALRLDERRRKDSDAS